MKAMVLSSGGVDSTTCLALAVHRLGAENVAAVSVFYGQKHDKELTCARQVAAYYKVKHYELDLSAVFAQSNCSLLKQSTEDIVHKSYADQIAENGEGMVATYVPFRNGLMLSAVASLAMSVFPDDDVKLYLGAHADDAAGNAYADCSEAFVNAMGRAISLGTYNKVTIEAPFNTMNKAELVRVGLSLGVPYEMTWSCYEGGDTPCRSCGTCTDREYAFGVNGVVDPLLTKLGIADNGITVESDANRPQWLFAGDSITRGYDVPFGKGWVEATQAKLPTIRIHNVAVDGATLAAIYNQLDANLSDVELVKHHYVGAFVMGGTNDMLHDRSAADCFEGLKRCVARIQKAGLTPVVGLPPQIDCDPDGSDSLLREYNKLVAAYCEAQGIAYIDFYKTIAAADKRGEIVYAGDVHPNEKGYQYMCDPAIKILVRKI